MRETLDEARAIVNGNPTDYSLMKAVWLADLAVELTLATVVADLNLVLGSKVEKNPLFRNYLDAIDGATNHPELSSLKSHFASLHTLHKARNGVHNALAVSHSSSRNLVQTANQFIATVFANVYGLEVDRLSLTSFLKPGSARDRLEKAELKMEQRSYSEAMFEIAVALKLGRRQLRETLKEKQNSDLWSEKLFPSMVQSFRSISSVEKAVKELAYFFELSRYGVDVDKAIRYSERVPGIIGFDEETLISASGIQGEYSRSEAQEYLDFVADALYRFQSYSEKL